MRWAYVCGDAGVPIYGEKGCSVHLQEVVRALQRRGASIDIHAARLGASPHAGTGRARCFEIGAVRSGDAVCRERAAISANDEIGHSLAAHGPYAAVYERQSLWSTAGMEFARSAGVPAILEVNAPLIEEQTKYRQLIHRAEAESALDRNLQAASLVVAVSPGVARYLERRPAAVGKVHVVANGVDPNRFIACDRASRTNHATFTVGFIGTLKPWHGLTHLVDAFERLHRLHAHTRLLIVGAGPERDAINADLHARKLGHVSHLTGAVAPAEVPKWLDRMDVGVAPYPACEDFYFSPLKVLEYMAAGLPVVASRLGDIPKWVRHEQEGLLCDPGDVDSLSNALERLLRQPELARMLGARARSHASRDHSWDAVTDRVLRLAGLAGEPA